MHTNPGLGLGVPGSHLCGCWPVISHFEPLAPSLHPLHMDTVASLLPPKPHKDTCRRQPEAPHASQATWTPTAKCSSDPSDEGSAEMDYTFHPPLTQPRWHPDGRGAREEAGYSQLDLWLHAVDWERGVNDRCPSAPPLPHDQGILVAIKLAALVFVLLVLCSRPLLKTGQALGAVGSLTPAPEGFIWWDGGGGRPAFWKKLYGILSP